MNSHGADDGHNSGNVALGAAGTRSGRVRFGVGRGTVCQNPGCGREYRRARHRHCCSLCSVGRHTPRCDDDWVAYQRRISRAQQRVARRVLTVCENQSCRRVAGLGHTRCCTLCAWSGGRDCHARQQYVLVQDPSSLHQADPASSSDAPFHDGGTVLAVTSSDAVTEPVQPAGDQQGQGVISVLDSDEEADMAIALAASFEDHAGSEDVACFNFEEMD